MATKNTFFLVGGIPTPLKNVSWSVGMMKFPIYGKMKHVPNHQPDTFFEKKNQPDKKSYCWQTIITYPSMIPWETCSTKMNCPSSYKLGECP